MADALAVPANDAGKVTPGTAAEWLKLIDASEGYFKNWRNRVAKLLKIYLNKDDENKTDSARFNLLWSNVSTLQPTIYSRPPVPVVTRRFKDKDRVAKEAGEVLERGLIYTIDKSAFDDVMRDVRDDFLLAGRGTAWVRYEVETAPIPPAEGAQPAGDVEEAEQPGQEQPGEVPEQITDERVCADFVNWEDFGHVVARRWSEVWAVWRRVFMDRDELIKRFGEEKGKAVQLDHKVADDNNDKGDDNKKATVYEVWCKRDKKVYWVAKGASDVLDEKPPLLDLEDFYPCPQPAYSTLETRSLIPVPDYVFYQNQAEQIDNLSARIAKLTDALKLVGFYAAGQDSTPALQEAFKPGKEHQLIPVPGWAAFVSGGGTAGQIQWLPIDQVIKVLEGCQAVKAQLISDVYQITGISDIIRGESNPNETATAQSIKNQWGSVRVRDKQTEMARFARDLLRIMAEIMADKFQPQTLMAMTGKQFPTKEQLQMQVQQMAAQYKQQVQQTVAQGQEPPKPPEMPQDMPVTLEDVMTLLRDDKSRGYRIDVETDSTISTDEQQDQEQWTELLTAIANFMGTAMPVGQQIPQFVPVLGEMLQTTVRKFRAGRQLEDTLDAAIEQITAASKDQLDNPQPDPEQVKAETEMKAVEMKAKAEVQSTEMNLQAEREKHAMQRETMAMQHGHKMEQAAARQIIPMNRGQANG